MSKSSPRFFWFVFLACVFLAQFSAAAEGASSSLVSAQWLQAHRKDADVLLLDASPAQVYAAKHIPGALSADFMTYGAQEKPVAEMEELFRSWGVTPGKKVVLYDQGGSYLATRVFFSLYYQGFPVKDLFILDGGLSKWQQEGFAVTQEATPAPPKGSFAISRRNSDVKAELPEVLSASGDPANNVLLEALGPDWHFGQVAPFDRAGHIPNGILLPAADLYNPDKTFKSPDDLRKMLAYLGIRPEQRIYTYCGGGVAASAPFFALKFLLNYPKVALYTGSELEWLSDERGLPYWTYDAPSLMRQTGWLQFWAGPMIRMFRGANISIVDVRPADAFSQGHLPFSINVPAESFRNNLASPDKLAAMLGPAGIDAAHEAVIVSGAGLTKDSALAFVMLQKLGQKKVSLFMDSMDKWTQLGQPVKKDATVVGPKKTPQDLSIPPTNYPASFRPDVVISAAQRTQGLFPRVVLASGQQLTGKAPEGTVVHVPYTDLLTADGLPKPAKDIWNILSKAGVPRYAELICYSEDPGEAAVNYFVLKLMGYPDVKVLLPSAAQVASSAAMR